MAEQQRDEALNHVKALTDKLDQISISGNSFRTNELRGMPLHKLKTLQVSVCYISIDEYFKLNDIFFFKAKLRTELEDVEKVLYLETATKCMKCEEKNRSVTLVPCNHYVLCEACASTQRECPYCQTPTSQA